MTGLELVVAAALQAASPSWYACTDDLVKKNHAQPVDAEVLAHRIAEECHKVSARAEEASGVAGDSEILRTIKGDFERMVRDRIVAARAAALKLVR